MKTPLLIILLLLSVTSGHAACTRQRGVERMGERVTVAANAKGTQRFGVSVLPAQKDFAVTQESYGDFRCGFSFVRDSKTCLFVDVSWQSAGDLSGCVFTVSHRREVLGNSQLFVNRP